MPGHQCLYLDQMGDVMITRSDALEVVIPSSWFVTIGSFLFALYVHFLNPCLLIPYGYTLLGLWVIVPPLWFLFEWTLSLELAPDEKENIKQYQELARNVWLAVIVLLGALMRAKLDGSG